jgi:Icc protein
MTLLAQISDLHLRPRGLAALRVSETNMFAERVVDRLARMTPRPDAVLITGDLADTGDAKEYHAADEILSRLPMPWFAIPGNHDSAAQMRRSYRAAEWATQTTDGSLQFRIDVGQLTVIGLDTSVPGKAFGRLDPERLGFLEQALSAARERPTIVALHHPPIATGIRHMDNSMLRNPEDLAAILAGHDQVIRVLCGHQHRPITTTFAGRPMMVAPGVAHQIEFDLTESGPSAFNFEPPAFLIHKWTQETGLVSHMAYVERFEGPYPFWPDKDVTWPGL